MIANNSQFQILKLYSKNDQTKKNVYLWARRDKFKSNLSTLIRELFFIKIKFYEVKITIYTSYKLDV